MEFIENFIHCFIPLFVAIDAPGILPVFLAFSEDMNKEDKNRLITQATLTAFVISLAFLFLGKLIFLFLGITKDDFRIAGGVVLFLISISDLVIGDSERRRRPSVSVGVVPLGVPLIIGPAVLTTVLILVDSYGYVQTLISLIFNLVIVWLIFRKSDYIVRTIGRGGSKAFAKVAHLFLAAIGVKMVRLGLTNLLNPTS